MDVLAARSGAYVTFPSLGRREIGDAACEETAIDVARLGEVDDLAVFAEPVYIVRCHLLMRDRNDTSLADTAVMSGRI